MDAKHPPRPNSRDSPQKRQKVAKQHTYGQLIQGDVPIKSKKVTLKTFFGNPEQEIFVVRFDHEDQVVAAGCSDGAVKLFNLQSGKLAFNLQGSSEGSTPTTCLRWRKDTANKTKGVFISGNADGSIMFWHSLSGKQLHRIVEQNNAVLCMDLRQDGEVFATGGRDFKLRIYDDEKKAIIRTMDPGEQQELYIISNSPGHINRVFSIKFLDDNPQVLISGGWDGNVLIWDLREEKSIGCIFGPNLTGDSLDYKNGQILTGSYRTNDQIQLWDFKTRTLQRQIHWSHEQVLDDYYIYSCQFSKYNNDTILAGSSGRQEIKAFDINHDYLPCAYIKDIHDGIYTVDYGNKTNKFAYGGGEGVVYICSLASQKVVK